MAVQLRKTTRDDIVSGGDSRYAIGILNIEDSLGKTNPDKTCKISHFKGGIVPAGVV